MRSGAPVPAQISFFLYNTTCSIFLFDRRPDADALLSGAKEIAHAVRRMLDFYDPDSELGRLNRSYIPGQPYAVSEELASFLQTILSFSVQSGGCYDPTLGPVSKLWNFPSGEPQVPEADALRAALSRCGPRLIRCSERTVTLDRPGMLLDAGGAGKGYPHNRPTSLPFHAPQSSG